MSEEFQEALNSLRNLPENRVTFPFATIFQKEIKTKRFLKG
jgi:hypothetical protein